MLNIKLKITNYHISGHFAVCAVMCLCLVGLWAEQREQKMMECEGGGGGGATVLSRRRILREGPRIMPAMTERDPFCASSPKKE